MSKVTDLKLNRLFTTNKGTTDNMRRAEIVPPLPTKKVGDCFVCGKPVMAGHGQILKWYEGKNGEHRYSHKACRKLKGLS